MKYDNRFFETEAEARAFRKQRGGGVLLHVTKRSRRQTWVAFHTEMAVAYDARREEVDPEKTPWCVAWNVFN